VELSNLSYIQQHQGIQFFTLEEEPVYTCDDAIQTSFLQIFLSPLIKQEFGTESEQSEDYEYEDSENKDDGEEEGSDTLSTSSIPTALP
jgi:hypothetical protein